MLDKGIFQFDKVTIAPNMCAELLEDTGAFQRFQLKTATIYLAEARLEAISWDLRITAREGTVKGLELRMMDKAAALNERLGSADKEGLGRIKYSFEWGSICSYMGIKTRECVIRVEY